MSIYDKIASGEYEPRIHYPDKPCRPAVLKKRVEDCSPYELANLKNVLDEYNASMEAYNKGQAAYQESQNEAQERFWNDLAAEHGLDRSEAFVQIMESIAWDRGHSCGYNDIASEYQGLVSLHEEHARAIAACVLNARRKK